MNAYQKAKYNFQRFTAFCAAPVLRVTGYRFSKKWRGNPVIDHVAANLMADGFDVPRMKF